MHVGRVGRVDSQYRGRRRVAREGERRVRDIKRPPTHPTSTFVSMPEIIIAAFASTSTTSAGESAARRSACASAAIT